MHACQTKEKQQRQIVFNTKSVKRLLRSVKRTIRIVQMPLFLRHTLLLHECYKYTENVRMVNVQCPTVEKCGPC
jgi:hypothetical protein